VKHTIATMDVSVIICAYTENRWRELIAAVDSVTRQNLSPLEIIVVIDHNSELHGQARKRFAQALVLENHEIPGLSGARNTGIQAAHGAIVAFLDDDAIAMPDWLERLVVTYANPALIGVGGTIEPAWQSGRPAWFPEEFNWVVGCSYVGLPREAAPVRNLIGANMSFRRDVFATVGGFRNGMGRVGTTPVGCEETELCIRIGQRWPDRVILYDPAIKVIHQVPEGRTRWAYFKARCQAEGMSKALVTSFVGSPAGLASEREYVLRALPSGVWHGLRDFVQQGDWNGLTRAVAILAGLAFTTIGFLKGRFSVKMRPQPSGPPQIYEEMEGAPSR
jgi:glycosyltransferase involved in cell wall biosynthesis